MIRLLALTLALACSVAHAHPGGPELVAAMGDPAELARIAERLGARGLDMLLSGPPPYRRAAIRAAVVSPHAARHLPRLVALAGGPDPEVARDAADAAAAIARRLGPEGAALEDLPPDVILAAAAACARVARGDHPVPVRASALACASDVAKMAGGRGPLAELMNDPEPEVRRAAVALAPADLRAAVLVRAEDPDETVALAAGGWACAAGAWAELGTEGRARMATLVLDARHEPGDLVAVLRCLRSSRVPAERKAAAQVARSRTHPAPVRRAAKKG